MQEVTGSNPVSPTIPDLVRHPPEQRLLAAVVGLAATLVVVGCGRPTPEPTQIGEPLPGSFRMTSDPPQAPYRVTVRLDDAGGPSGRTAEFAPGDQVLVQWSTLSLPAEKWIEVNGRDCQGTFGIQQRIETDLLLVLRDDGCRVEVVGMHPEGEIHPLPVD